MFLSDLYLERGRRSKADKSAEMQQIKLCQVSTWGQQGEHVWFQSWRTWWCLAPQTITFDNNKNSQCRVFQCGALNSVQHEPCSGCNAEVWQEHHKKMAVEGRLWFSLQVLHEYWWDWASWYFTQTYNIYISVSVSVPKEL